MFTYTCCFLSNPAASKQIISFDFEKQVSALPKAALSNPVAIRHMWRQAFKMWRQEVSSRCSWQ